MSNSATHSIRFSGAVYDASKDSYIERFVSISIDMASTVVALKVLNGSFTTMFTYIAGLTGVSRINVDERAMTSYKAHEDRYPNKCHKERSYRQTGVLLYSHLRKTNGFPLYVYEETYYTNKVG